MDGIVTFKPDSIQTVTTNSPVIFDEIVVNDSVHLYPGSSADVLSSQTSSLRILFSSPYFSQDANIKFSYSINGKSGDWKDLGNSRSIVFNNLPGGTYTLLLKREEAAGLPVTAALSFEIKKKFTETILFRILLLVLIVTVVYLFFKTRIRYLQGERSRLEKEVTARTVDQSRLIDKLNNNIEELTQLQNELSQMIAHKENIIAVLIHDIKSPLYFLNTVAAHLNKSIEQNTTAKNKEIIREIAASLNQLYLFAQDFTVWLNASGERRIQIETVHLRKIIGEVIMMYHDLIVKKRIELEVSSIDEMVLADEPILKSVIRNLVDNAIKNTSSGKIIITTKIHNHHFYIKITDEGKGMTPEQIEELNAYFNSDKNMMSFSSRQFGHKIIKDFLHKLEGSICYTSNAPSGVTVTLTLPLADKTVIK